MDRGKAEVAWVEAVHAEFVPQEHGIDQQQWDGSGKKRGQNRNRETEPAQDIAQAL